MKDQWQERAESLEDTLRRKGYQPCDIPACNCQGWHCGHAEERLREFGDVLAEAGLEPLRKPALVALKELVAERDTLRSAAAPKAVAVALTDAQIRAIVRDLPNNLYGTRLVDLIAFARAILRGKSDE